MSPVVKCLKQLKLKCATEVLNYRLSFSSKLLVISLRWKNTHRCHPPGFPPGKSLLCWLQRYMIIFKTKVTQKNPTPKPNNQKTTTTKAPQWREDLRHVAEDFGSTAEMDAHMLLSSTGNSSSSYFKKTLHLLVGCIHIIFFFNQTILLIFLITFVQSS